MCAQAKPERGKPSVGEIFGLEPVPRADHSMGKQISRRDLFLFVPEEKSGIAHIPEIQCPVAVNGRLDWRRIWYRIQVICRNEADILAKAGSPNVVAFGPVSPRRWLAAVLDELNKEHHQHLADHCHYWLHGDICAWAYLFTMREISLRHPTIDEERIERGQLSANACRFLVTRFYEFAQARRRFHAVLLTRLSKLNGYEHSWDKVASMMKGEQFVSSSKGGSGEKPKKKQGRPKKVRWKNEDRDLWLVLIWPVAVRNRWTYADLLRAERLFFRDGAPESTKATFAGYTERIENREKANRDIFFGRSSEEQDWAGRIQTVCPSDAKSMESRCLKLGIIIKDRKLSPTSKLRKPRRRNQPPRNIETILLIPPSIAPEL